MSNPANNDPIITLRVRNDIWDVIQTSHSKVQRKLRVCTSCIPKVLTNNPGYKHEVIKEQPVNGVCELCSALTYTMAMDYLGVTAYQLNHLIQTAQIHTVTSRGISYRVIRIPFSI